MNIGKWIIISATTLPLIGFLYFAYLLTPAAAAPGSYALTIADGSSFEEIAAAIAGAGFARSPGVFKAYSFLSGSAHQLKPGRYTFDAAMSLPEVVRRLVVGPQDVEVLITEGRTVSEIDAILADKGLIAAGELVGFPLGSVRDDYAFLGNAKTLEGFLFPDTYRFMPGSSVRAIVRKLLDAFSDKALPILAGLDGKRSDWYATLITASLLEREVPFASDRRLVAGILAKRLAIGMPLQVDATVAYTVCGGRFEGCPPLTKNDLRVSSAYNTYRVKGLPPAPIANPGIGAIIASLQPTGSPYLYYLSDRATEKTVFAKTLDEHNKNRARYLHL